VVITSRINAESDVWTVFKQVKLKTSHALIHLHYIQSWEIDTPMFYCRG